MFFFIIFQLKALQRSQKNQLSEEQKLKVSSALMDQQHERDQATQERAKVAEEKVLKEALKVSFLAI